MQFGSLWRPLRRNLVQLTTPRIDFVQCGRNIWYNVCQDLVECEKRCRSDALGYPITGYLITTFGTTWKPFRSAVSLRRSLVQRRHCEQTEREWKYCRKVVSDVLSTGRSGILQRELAVAVFFKEISHAFSKSPFPYLFLLTLFRACRLRRFMLWSQRPAAYLV